MPRDDDDDRPRKRRPRDDDDDDRPRKRRERDDEDDDRRPSSARRRARRDEDDDDRPRKKKKARPVAREMNPLALVGMIVGILALVVAIFMPCFASWSLIISGLGIVLSFVALAMAQKSDGRYGPGMPITGVSLSGLAVLAAVGWLVLGKKVEKEGERIGKEIEAQVAKEEAEQKRRMEKAAGEVKAAGEGTAIQVTAAQFYRAYDEDDEQADRVYKDKIIELTGTVDEVDTDDENGPTYTVYLRGGRRDSVVNCEFLKSPDVRARLGQLKKGDTVRIRGKCPGGDSGLEGCVLVE
jgi:hypothetical protein